MNDKTFNRALAILAFVAAGLIATDSRAQTEVLNTPNASGGQIYLTVQNCPAASLTADARSRSRYVYATSLTGEMSTGCYFLNTTTNNVHIYWIETRTYSALPLNIFWPTR